MDNLLAEKIRKDFPILSMKRNGKPLVYLDSSATSQKPRVVIDAITSLYKEYNANIHRGVYSLSEETTAKYEQSKKIVADFIHAPSFENIIYTRNTTEGLNICALMLERQMRAGDEILVTIMEHHSNLIPWMKVCERTGAILKYIPILEDGSIDIEVMKHMISDKTKILAISHVSNVLGTINPLKVIISFAHEYGIIAVVDGAQAVGHISVDVTDIDADFYSFSGHKMFAPTGVGVLYVKDIYFANEPVLYGGDMVDHVEKNSIIYKQMPYKFEAGTSNYEGGIALGSAITYIQGIGVAEIEKKNLALMLKLEKELAQIPGVKIYGTSEKKSSVTSFSVEKIHPHDIASLLDKDNVCIRAGMHCAQPLVNDLGHLALSRASIHVYNNEEDIEIFIQSVKHAISILTSYGG